MGTNANRLVLGVALAGSIFAVTTASAANFIAVKVKGPQRATQDFWDTDSFRRIGPLAEIRTLTLLYGRAFGGSTYGWEHHWRVNCEWGWIEMLPQSQRVHPDGTAETVSTDSEGRIAFPWSSEVEWIKERACGPQQQSPKGGFRTAKAAIQYLEKKLGRLPPSQLSPINVPAPPLLGFPRWDHPLRLSVVAKEDGNTLFMEWSRREQKDPEVTAWTITLLKPVAGPGMSSTVRLRKSIYNCRSSTYITAEFSDFSRYSAHGPSSGEAGTRRSVAGPGLAASELAAACGPEPTTQSFDNLPAVLLAADGG